MNIEVKVLRNERARPVGKLADVEIHFIDGDLAGLKLMGLAIWTRREGPGRSVTFPSRQFIVHGEKRSFALLRSIDDPGAQDHIRKVVLEAYDAQAPAVVKAAS